MADAHNNHQHHQNVEVEDAYSCVEDPEPRNVAKKNEEEVDQISRDPRFQIVLDFNRVVIPAGKKSPPRAQSLIGRMVYKKWLGVGYVGTVVDYDPHRRWFRVEYDNEGSEDLLESEVRFMLATSTQIERHQRQRQSLNNNNNGEKHVEAAGPSTSSKPKRKRMGMSDAGQEKFDDNYVPMSQRGGKNNSYFRIH